MQKYMHLIQIAEALFAKKLLHSLPAVFLLVFFCVFLFFVVVVVVFSGRWGFVKLHVRSFLLIFHTTLRC